MVRITSMEFPVMSRASGKRARVPPVRWHRHRSHGTHVRGLVPGAPLQAARRLRGSRVRFRGTAGHRPFGSCSWDDASGRFGLRSGRSWAAASGSRWAATGVRNDRGARAKTVEEHDRRSCHRRPLTWHSSCLFPGRQRHAVARPGWAAEDGSTRSVVEVVAEEPGASLRWATATTTRTTRSQEQASTASARTS